MREIFSKIKREIVDSSWHFQEISPSLRKERIAEIFIQFNWLYKIFNCQICLRIILFFVNDDSIQEIVLFAIFFIFLETCLYQFSHLKKSTEEKIASIKKDESEKLSKLENKIGLLSIVTIFVQLIFPISPILGEKDALTKGIAIFMHYNSIQFSGNAFMIPDIQMEGINLIFISIFTTIFLLNKNEFSVFFYLSSAGLAHICTFIFNSRSKSRLEKLLKKKKEKINLKRDILEIVEEPVIIINCNNQIQFRNKAFNRPNKDIENGDNE